MKPTTETRKALRKQVFELSADLRRMVETMLGQATSFEDTAAALNRRGYTGISVDSVEIYYRAHPEVQQERIRFQLATARALKKALLDPESEESELAEAALFTGLVDLTRWGVRFNVGNREEGTRNSKTSG